MAERRQAHRREPIEVEVRERVLEARPLPWFKRNDLGNLILSQYSEIVNIMMQTYVDQEGGPPRLEVALNDKLKDPVAIVKFAYEDDDHEFFHRLEYPELLDLIYAALDVNELQSLREMVDPNFLPPTSSGGNDSSGTEAPETDTPNQQPTPDSSSQESVDQTSSSSPTEKSSPSSENKTENSGTSDGGSSL